MNISDSKIKLDEIADKIIVGVNLANRKLVKESAVKNRNLTIGDKNGGFKSVPARELLKTLSK